LERKVGNRPPGGCVGETFPFGIVWKSASVGTVLSARKSWQDGYFDRGQHFHGDLLSSNLRSRSWAILHNYWLWSPESAAANGGARCPAERLNGKSYSDGWLQNLLIAASLAGTKKSPPKIRND